MNPISILMLATFGFFSTQAMPLFDADLAASPLVHEVRINYRGGRKFDAVKY